MKKILSLLFVSTLILTSVFAVDVSANIGGGAVFNTGKFYDSKNNSSSTGYPKEYKSILLNVDLGVEVEFDNHLVVYDTISAGFLGDEIRIMNSNETKFSNCKLKSSFLIADSIGVGYKFHCSDFDFLAGCGLKADIFEFKLKEQNAKFNIRNFGVGLNLKGSYFFNDRIAAMIAVRPSISFYDSWAKTTNSSSTKSNGAATGYAIAGVIGLEYKF